MRRSAAIIAIAATLWMPCAGAERRSWNKIRYVGGTILVKTSPYDWNTTLTINLKPESIMITIAPGKLFTAQQTVRILPIQVLSLSAGSSAWRKVEEVSGAQLPAKAPTLFGLLQDNGFLGIVYQTEDGKRAAILLDTYFSWQILPILQKLTGKTIENMP